MSKEKWGTVAATKSPINLIQSETSKSSSIDLIHIQKRRKWEYYRKFISNNCQNSF